MFNQTEMKNKMLNKWMQLRLPFGILLATVMVTVSATSPLPNARKLLLASDQARGGNIDGLIMDSTVTAYHGDEAGKSYTIRVYSDTNNSLVTFLYPQHSTGIKFLMRGRNMWLISRESRKPIPISPRQRLLGDASNGDIATTNYGRDYDAKTIGEVLVKDVPSYKLELTARAPNVTYHRILYYISKDTKLALKAEYFTASGKHFKTAYFEYANQLQLENGSYPFVSRMEIVNELTPQEKTELVYRNPQASHLPPSTFDTQYLMLN